MVKTTGHWNILRCPMYQKIGKKPSLSIISSSCFTLFFASLFCLPYCISCVQASFSRSSLSIILQNRFFCFSDFHGQTVNCSHPVPFSYWLLPWILFMIFSISADLWKIHLLRHIALCVTEENIIVDRSEALWIKCLLLWNVKAAVNHQILFLMKGVSAGLSAHVSIPMRSLSDQLAAGVFLRDYIYEFGNSEARKWNCWLVEILNNRNSFSSCIPCIP